MIEDRMPLSEPELLQKGGDGDFLGASAGDWPYLWLAHRRRRG
jgi:hypothetical protein